MFSFNLWSLGVNEIQFLLEYMYIHVYGIWCSYVY